MSDAIATRALECCTAISAHDVERCRRDPNHEDIIQKVVHRVVWLLDWKLINIAPCIPHAHPDIGRHTGLFKLPALSRRQPLR